jgi:hypothetical protein
MGRAGTKDGLASLLVIRARIGNIVQSIPRHESYDGKAKPKIRRELPRIAHVSSRASPERKKTRKGG